MRPTVFQDQRPGASADTPSHTTILIGDQVLKDGVKSVRPFGHLSIESEDQLKGCEGLPEGLEGLAEGS